MELLSRKSASDKKWKQYQLLQIPFLCGTSSVFSHTENEKNNFLEKVCPTEDKDYSSSDNETTAERDNKEKKNSLYIIPTFKPLKSIQPLAIPNFRLSCISNKINSKMPSTNLKETDWKNFKGQPSLMQSKQIYGVQKMSEIGKQKLQNDKSNVKPSTVSSEFKENNYQSVSKQEHGALAEGGKVSVMYFRGNSTDTECNQIFAENYFRDKMLENSDGDDDQKSKIHIYISAKNIQNEKYVRMRNVKRMGRKRSNENVGTFHIQTSIPVTTEALEKNKLDVHCGVHNSNSDTRLYGAESKLSAKQMLDFKRYLTKKIVFESNCPCIVVQNFPDKKVNCNIFRGKEMFKLKFSFQNMLFGWVRTWTECLYKDTSMCQGNRVTHWLHFRETLNEQCDAQELVKSDINRNHNNKICICLLAIILKHLKVELLETILASFFNSTNTLLPTGGKSVHVEKHPLCGREQDQLKSCTENTLRQNTGFHKKIKTYPGFASSKFVESMVLEFHNECQRRDLSRSLGEEESTLLKRGTFFHNQKRGLCKGRHVRKHHLISRGSEGFCTYLRSVSHKNSMKKQISFAKCPMLLQGTFACSSVDKMYCCNITKIQYLIGSNLRFWSYFPAYSQQKFEKVNIKCTNREISVTTVKQDEKKQSKMCSSSFHRERFKTFPFVLCENKKHETTRYRNSLTSTNEVTDEVTYTMKKYLGTSSYINANKKECVKSKELQINSHSFLSKKFFSVFDTYEKIPLTTDSGDFDQIPVVNQDNSVKKKLSEENADTCSKEIHNLPFKSGGGLILPEESKTTMEKYNSLLLRDSQTNQPECCKKIDTYSPHLANKEEKVEDKNTYLNFENLFPSSPNVYQSVTLPLENSSFVNRVGSQDGHCRTSSADKQNQSKQTHATIQYPSRGSPTMTDTYLQLQAKERVQFSVQGHTQTHKEVNESKTFIAAEEKLKMHLSIMNNGCLEDVKDKYLPLENKITYEFELKRKFDLVLEELHMFHEISKGDENNLSSLETNSHNNYCELNNSEGIDENATSVSQKKTRISSPIHGTIEGQNITDSNESSLKEKISNENEDQKGPNEHCISRLSSEALLHSPAAEGYFDVTYEKPYTWDPAFLSCTLLTEQNYNLQKEGGKIIRVQPLKTCKGPIRIGLSRKARPKQLHPYLK
uniref:RAD51 interacting motif domain-containing protein n=1 Tax=Athene cunicularia TaxID=194338 RepID=A0A663MQ36_ATHCN